MTKDQFKEEVSKLVLSTMRSMGTAKFYILISSSIFFWLGKLDQSSWISAVLTVAGLTQASTIAEIMKGSGTKTQTTTQTTKVVSNGTRKKN